MRTSRKNARPNPGSAAERPRRRGRPPVAADGPDPVDVHVGGRVRHRRQVLGLSQAELARHLGLTFQQVQKYERGRNRLSASVLWHTAELLDVPVSFFFDGLDAPARADAPAADDPDGLALPRRIRALDPELRGKLSSLIATLGREEC